MDFSAAADDAIIRLILRHPMRAFLPLMVCPIVVFGAALWLLENISIESFKYRG